MKFIQKNQCTGCAACANICPKQCIQMTSDREGFLYPKIIPKKCIQCNLCEQICPVNSVQKEKNIGTSYAAYHRDENIRSLSSSGGVFSVFAESIIKNSGVVFGAALDENLSVRHRRCETLEELDFLRRSKYVQSEMGDIYQQTYEVLQSGREVLFCGTPCQINGLKKYMNKKKAAEEKLLTMDFICHGVPSPQVWQDYCNWQQKNINEKITECNFRSKVSGWTHFSMELKGEKSEYSQSLEKDPYMLAFLKNICLRPSCYQCPFKGTQKVSDITVGDFWGIQNILPDWNDDKGVSLVLVNSQKGKDTFDKIKNRIYFTPVVWKDVIKYNQAYYNSPWLPAGRKRFMGRLHNKPFDIRLKKG